MDLLFKNPRYFFETYFNIPPSQLLVVFLVSYTLVVCFLMIRRAGVSARDGLLIAAYALYLSLVIGTTLLNQSRGGVSGVVLDPLVGLRKVIHGNDVHSLREMASNVLLFLPFGVLTPRCLRVRAIVAVLLGLLLSAGIEASQWLLGVGWSQTEDVALNVIGVILGCLLYWLVRRWGRGSSSSL